MKEYISLFFGMFCVMALSNAIVPFLPVFATSSSLQGAIYAAYFLGAFASTLPGGMASDRIGHLPVMRLGLALTVLSGVLLLFHSHPVLVPAARFIEGIGAGLFVAAAMSYVNSRTDHVRLSGYLMAIMNAGLVIGLVFSGWMGVVASMATSGVIVFTILCVIPSVAGFFVAEQVLPVPSGTGAGAFVLLSDNLWLFYSAVVLVGITGVISSLYPEFSDLPPDILGVWIAAMSVSTILSVLITSRIDLPPVATIRIAAVLMAVGMAVAFFTPAGFLIIGAIAGVVMIVQMAFLSGVRGNQGVAMGLFATSSYLGMAVLPAITGAVADMAGFSAAFLTASVLAITVTLTIGRCACRNQYGQGPA
jgi:predicted MFS family arabinose efflux permease